MTTKAKTTMTPIQILDRINDLIGTFWGAGQKPTAGASKAIIMADMPSNQITDPTNYLRIRVYADFGQGPVHQPGWLDWRGGPGQTAPQLTYNFDPNHPPQLVYGVLENGTNGAGSPAVCGLTIAFA